MKKSIRKNVEEDCSYRSRNAALKSEDPFKKFEISTDCAETTMSTLREVSKYISACLQFGDNPLPHLRRYFPDFEWKFHNPETSGEVAKIIATIDYAIPEDYGATDWSLGFFTASLKNMKVRRKICYCPEWNDDADLFIWPFEELIPVEAMILLESQKGGDGKYYDMLVSAEEALSFLKKVMDKFRASQTIK